MWALVRAATAMLLGSLLLFSPALADKRVALIVGNSAYQNAPALTNPSNDAQDIAAALSDLSFQVISGTDLDKRALDAKVREFSRALEGADVGLFFYAGHGLQVKGSNYLVATDAKLEAERDLDFEAVKVDFVLSIMEREAKTNIVFLDACRNNPLARNLARTMGTRGVGENNGLAQIKSEALGLGTFIAFATQPGNVASDGTGRNSPFSAALKKHIVTPGVTISDLMIDVRKDVIKETNSTQVPWDHSALQGRFYFNTIQAAAPPTSTPAQLTAPMEAAGEWSRVDKRSLVELETFLRRHPASPEADYARSRLAALKEVAKTAECSAEGQWEQTASDVGTSTWILTRSGNGYHAQENGMGNAVGTAVMSGNGVRIEWRTGDYSGRYEWEIDPSCTTGEGQLVFYTGATGTHRSVARRVAQPAGETKSAGATSPVTGSTSTSKVHAQRHQLVTLLDGTLRLRVTDSYAHGACTFEYDPGATGRFSETENLKTAEWITTKLASGSYKITLVAADDESCTFEFAAN
jgi:hypothetical protein